MKHKLIVIGASAIALAWPIDAFAQAASPVAAPDSSASNADRGIGEIIVTAQRRSESLQKTALSISVVRPESIANAGVTSAAQLTSLLPTVQVGSAGPATSVYIRGVGGFQSTAATSPAVPYYVDGVYVARTPSLSSEFFDVERVEVLKGPQGTLYGRNASGGAINFLTARPDMNRVSGHIEGEVGNYSDKSIEAALNIPLSSTLAVRASGTIVDKGGYTSLGLGDDVHQAGRVKLLWHPTSDVSLLLNASYGHIGGRTSAVGTLNRQIPGWYPWLDISDPRTVAYGNANAALPYPIVRTSGPADADAARQDGKFLNLSAQLDWQLGGATLTVIPAYRRSRLQNVGLFGFTTANGDGIGSLPPQPERSNATSLEVRLAGDSRRLKWLVGAFYFNEDQFQQYTVDGGWIQHVGASAIYGTRSYAAFTQNSFALSPAFRLIAGGRYTSDRRTVDGQSYVITPAFFPPPSGAACAAPLFPGAPLPTAAQCVVDQFVGRTTFKNFSWKFGAEADVAQNSLLYATVSRGFKAGGFNLQSEGLTGQAQPYKPELLTSYDIGLKSRFVDDRLQLNLGGFYWDYRNHQEPVLTVNDVGVTNLIYRNAGKAEIYGASLDLIARPWTGGTIESTAEYAHSRYKDYTISIPTPFYNPATTGCRREVANSGPAETVLDCSGFEVARTPLWSGSVGITQQIPLGSGRLEANGNMNFASSRWISVDFLPIVRAPSYTKFDASLTYHPEHNHWYLTGFVRNITNAAIYTTGGISSFNPLGYGYIQPPRTYGARFGVNF